MNYIVCGGQTGKLHLRRESASVIEHSLCGQLRAWDSMATGTSLKSGEIVEAERIYICATCLKKADVVILVVD